MIYSDKDHIKKYEINYKGKCLNPRIFPYIINLSSLNSGSHIGQFISCNYFMHLMEVRQMVRVRVVFIVGLIFYILQGAFKMQT